MAETSPAIDFLSVRPKQVAELLYAVRVQPIKRYFWLWRIDISLNGGCELIEGRIGDETLDRIDPRRVHEAFDTIADLKIAPLDGVFVCGRGGRILLVNPTGPQGSQRGPTSNSRSNLSRSPQNSMPAAIVVPSVL